MENCFKHGSSLDAGTPWIKIGLKTTEKSILLSTENSKPQIVAKNSTHVKTKYDLKELRKRLEIIYHRDGFKLMVESLEQSFKVHLELKQEIEVHNKQYR